ncbi:MAG: hypothetical protein ACQETV_00415 [Actinomycetota bacterium]
MATAPTATGEPSTLGPHPVRRALLALLLGAVLGLLAALLRPRPLPDLPAPDEVDAL